MSYYSEQFKFDAQIAIQEAECQGKKIYAKRFNAKTAEVDKGLVYKLAVATQLGHLEKIEMVAYELKWSRIKNSLCDPSGELVPNKFINNLMNTSDPEALEFIEVAYKLVQKVNEIGIHGRTKEDENGEKKQ
jgi:hypothetical protein